MTHPLTTHRFLPSFSRRIGKRLGVKQKALLKNVLPTVSIELPTSGMVKPAALFPFQPKAVWLEIGFGAGEFLAEQVMRHPDIGFIGCEPYLNGVANVLKLLEGKQECDNLRLWADDARRLLQCVEPDSIQKIFILFPDPWPKTRHHKRRIVSTEMLDLLHEKLDAGGELVLATDHTGYAGWMLEHILRHKGFTWQAQSPKDWKTPPEGWVPTRYEEKFRALGSEPVFFTLKKD